MPPPKPKSKEETWTPAELAAHLPKPGDGSKRRGAEASTADAGAAGKSRSSKDAGKKPPRDKKPASDSAATAATASEERHRSKDKDRDRERRHRERESKGADVAAASGGAGDGHKDKEHRSRDEKKSRDERQHRQAAGAGGGGGGEKDRSDRERKRDERHRDERKAAERTSRDDEGQRRHRDTAGKGDRTAAAAAAASGGGDGKEERRRHRDDKDRSDRKHREDKDRRGDDHRRSDAKDQHRDKDKDKYRDRDRDRDRERKRGKEDAPPKEEARRSDKHKEPDSSRDKKHRSRKHDGERKGADGGASAATSSTVPDQDNDERRRKEEPRERRTRRDEEKAPAAAEASGEAPRDQTRTDRAKEREADMMARLSEDKGAVSDHSDVGDLTAVKSQRVADKDKRARKRRQESDDVVDLVDESQVEYPVAPSMGSSSGVGVGLDDSDDGVEDEIENNYNYDDDEFEDYSEDFEEPEQGSGGEGNDGDDEHETSDKVPSEEVLAISQLMKDENDRITAEQRKRSKAEGKKASSTGTTSSRRRKATKFMDFKAAQKKAVSSVQAKKTQRRGEDLAQLIELDTMSFNIFEMPPQSEYELYMKRFGKSNTAQVAVQCNEDVFDREVQTDDVLATQKWTQCPPTDLRGKGVGVGTGTDGSDEGTDDVVTNVLTGEQAKRLNMFLQKAGEVCGTILDEQSAGQSTAALRPCPASSTVSKGYTPLQCTWPDLAERHVVCTQLTSQQDHQLLTAFSPPHSSKTDKIAGDLHNFGLLAVWHLSDLERPRRLLSSQSLDVTCCCFSPGHPVLVAAGTADGSVILWDLRDPASLHSVLEIVAGGEQCTCQTPTYCTDGTSLTDVHDSAVVALSPIASGGSTGSAGNLDRGSTVSFQLATLDEWGTVKIWVVVESQKPSDLDACSDLGLLPGGRVRLVFGATIAMTIPAAYDPRASVTIRAYSLCFQPGTTNRFFVGSDSGSVVHGLRFKSRPIPRLFESHTGAVVDVVSLDVSPWQPEYFLAGCSDGSVRLHHVAMAQPLVTWTQFVSSCTGVVCIRWLPCRPCVFLVVDKSSQLLTWDLSRTDTAPIAKDNFSSSGRIVSLSVSPHVNTGSNNSIRVNKPVEIVISFEGGETAIHHLTDEFNKAINDEEEQLLAYMKNLR